MNFETILKMWKQGGRAGGEYANPKLAALDFLKKNNIKGEVVSVSGHPSLKIPVKGFPETYRKNSSGKFFDYFVDSSLLVGDVFTYQGREYKVFHSSGYRGDPRTEGICTVAAIEN